MLTLIGFYMPADLACYLKYNNLDAIVYYDDFQCLSGTNEAGNHT